MPINISFSQGLRPAVAMSLAQRQATGIGLALSVGIGQLSTFVLAEIPGGAINGLNTAFTTLADYAKLWVYLNGNRMVPDEDYVEDGGNDFHFLAAPLIGDILIVDYVT